MSDLRSVTDGRGLLVPYRGPWPFTGAQATPFPISLTEFCDQTGYTQERRGILRGFLDYRIQLKSLGIKGFQWVDGSFLHHEDLYGRAPDDIDLVTWVKMADSSTKAQAKLLDKARKKDPRLLIPKVHFQTDAYLDFCSPEGWLRPSRAAYWIGLFSHTSGKEGTPKWMWKGFYQIDLADDEGAVNLEAANAS